jgi:hypothetical protein
MKGEGKRVWRVDKQEGGLVLKEHSYQGLCWRGVNVGQERASNQQDGLGVCRAGLVQTGLGMASFIRDSYLC